MRIGLEDLIANAMIERLEVGLPSLTSFKDLFLYGDAIVKYHNRRYPDYDEQVHIESSRDLTYMVQEWYRKTFEFFEDNNQSFVKLREGKTVDDLRSDFRGYLGLKLLITMTRAEVVKSLGVDKIDYEKRKDIGDALVIE